MGEFSLLYTVRIYFAVFTMVVSEFICNILNNLGIVKRKMAHLPAELEGKVVVITGANTGIGKATAKIIAEKGATVYLACRDQTRTCQAIDDIVRDVGESKRSKLHFIELNLSSLDSVRKAAAAISNQVPHIDVLINNAGVMMTPEWKTSEGYEFQFGTNHLGHFLLTQLLLTKLRAAPSGAKVVNVSAALHIPGEIYWDNLNMTGQYNGFLGYARSKLANIYFAAEMARRLGAGSKVKTYSLHPGVIQTKLARHVHPGQNQNQESWARRTFLISPLMGAQTTLYCAFDPEVANESGKYYDNCERVDSLFPHVTDEAAASRLWDLSLKLVDIDDQV